MSTEKKNFDNAASAWDEKPARVKIASDIGRIIISRITLNENMRVMDFGCGTGLITLQLAPFVHSVSGTDTSKGMLDVLKEKISARNIKNVNTRLIDPDNYEIPEKYDLIVSSMTLHHIEKIEPLIKNFHDSLVPGGYLCIADLDPDGGLFHENNTGVFHNGFARSKMIGIFTESGFENISIYTASEALRQDVKGEIKNLTIFLIIGNRRND